MTLCRSAPHLLQVIKGLAAQDPQGICRHGHNKLALAAGLDKKTVIKATNELLDAGLIQYMGAPDVDHFSVKRQYRPTPPEHLQAQQALVQRFDKPMHEVVRELATAGVVHPRMVRINDDGTDPWDTVLAGAVVGANFGE
jgi:predicted transcriptional regulator